MSSVYKKLNLHALIWNIRGVVLAFGYRPTCVAMSSVLLCRFEDVCSTLVFVGLYSVSRHERPYIISYSALWLYIMVILFWFLCHPLSQGELELSPCRCLYFYRLVSILRAKPPTLRFARIRVSSSSCFINFLTTGVQQFGYPFCFFSSNDTRTSWSSWRFPLVFCRVISTSRFLSSATRSRRSALAFSFLPISRNSCTVFQGPLHA